MSFLTEGFASLITIAGFTTIKLYEIEITPPEMKVGANIPLTTMRNTAWRTNAPGALLELTPMRVQCAYDPAVYGTCLTALKTNALMTVTFPDNSTLKFYGYLSSFKPTGIREGNRPVADIEIQPTLLNGSTETAPVYAAGT